MRKCLLAVTVALLMCVASGCASMRAFDQWKCDHLGWCCFGVRPSHESACEYCVPDADDACCPPDAICCPPGATVVPAAPCQTCP